MVKARPYRGMGSGAQLAQQGTSAAGSAAAFLVPASMIPVVGIAVAGIGLALSAIFNRKGPKQKVASTSIVNDLEPQLKANVAAYMNGPRTVSSQAAALKNFDAAWTFLQSSQGCGNPDLGNPGQACLADRSRGGRWPWEVYYRDPIANDPNVQPDPTTAQTVADALGLTASSASPSAAIGNGSLNTLLLFGLFALVVSKL